MSSPPTKTPPSVAIAAIALPVPNATKTAQIVVTSNMATLKKPSCWYLIAIDRMTGVDLTRIDGVDGFTALKVVSEVGTDMTKWRSAKHFASWLGLSPNNRITGGRVMSSKTKASANRAAAALRLAANALHRSDSALGAFLRRKKAYLGAPKAITATAHKLARLIYSMLRYGQEYVDAGTEYYESRFSSGRCVRQGVGAILEQVWCHFSCATSFSGFFGDFRVFPSVGNESLPRVSLLAVVAFAFGPWKHAEPLNSSRSMRQTQEHEHP